MSSLVLWEGALNFVEQVRHSIAPFAAASVVSQRADEGRKRA
jgi:hypothetical protein